MEPSGGSIARLESLMKWVNTFDGIECKSFNDFTSGEVLLKCLQTIMPDVMANNTDDPWGELFAIFEDFCGCTLEKAVSAEKIISGSQEHISRVIVLLLALAVQSKNNDRIISAITSLDYGAQRDIMFFIESTLAKVKSHAIVAGTFTSGVGEPLPHLETETTPIQCTPLSPSSPTNNRELDMTPLASKVTDETFILPTPRKPNRNCHSNFYNGLDSSAGAKLLMSPAIIGRTIRKSHIFTKPPTVKFKDIESEGDKEEISRLKHSIRVLEGTLQVEKKLAQEYYGELCGKIQECESLKKDYYQLERKLDCLQQMDDLQDELAHASTSLAAKEKSLQCLQKKVETLEGSKERAVELEMKLKECESTISLCEEQSQSVKQLESLLMEKMSALKRSELQLNKLTISMEMKSSQIESLLQENREHKRELNESKGKCKLLEDTINHLQMKLDSKADSEVIMMQEKQGLVLDVEKLQESLEGIKQEVSSLRVREKESSSYLTAFEQEKKELQEELIAKIAELSSKDFRIQSLEGSKTDLENEIMQLQSSLHALRQDLAIKETEIQNVALSRDIQIRSQVNTKKDLEAQVEELQAFSKTLEDCLAAKDVEIQQRLSSKDDQIKCLESARDELENQVAELKSSMVLMESKLSTKEEEIQNEIARIGLIESAGKKLEAHNVQLQHTISSLEQSLSTKEVEAASRESRISSLESTNAEQQEKVVDLQSRLEMLEQDLAAKTAKLAANSEDLSTQKEKLEEEMESLQSQYSTATAKICALESEMVSKAKSFTALMEEYAKIQTNMSLAEEEVSDCRASLESANFLNSSLMTEKSHLERRYAELQLNMKVQMDVNEANKTTILGLKSELDHSESLVQDLKALNIGLKGEQDQIDKLTRDNHMLISEKNKIMEKFSILSDKERKIASSNRQFEDELIREQAKCLKLNRYLSALKAELAASSTHTFDDSSLPVSCGECDNKSPSPLPSPELGSVAALKLEVEADEKDRVKELKRRNKQALPHLKSSYPIEMQMRPETPTTSNEKLKKIDRSSNSFVPATANQFQEPVCYNTRARSAQEPPYSRRLSAPPTPQTPTDLNYKHKASLMRQSMCPSLNLREFLDAPETRVSLREEQPNQMLSSTAFEVTFSPPKAKGSVPKRLQENKFRRTFKEGSAAGGTRRETLSKPKKVVATSSKSRGGVTTGRKGILKSNN